MKKGLANKTLFYLDVRNLDELKEEGKIAGTFNIPCKTNRDICDPEWDF